MKELVEIREQDSLYAKLLDANNLMVAAKLCMKGVTWKYSTQCYYLNRIERVCITKTRLENMDRMSDGFIVFWINERGKLRLIRSIHINERVVHRCENDDILVPVLRPRLIYDNYSSLKERGTRRCFERLKCFLQREFREYGDNESYILVWDLHSYFDSIDHDVVYEMYSKLFMESEKRNLYLLMDFIDAFGEVSLGLGSQVSQMTAMYYPNDIDHYIKEQLKIKHYGRYNDDFYLMHRDKEYLIHCANVIRQMYADKGIEMNENKMRICKIGKEFKFLKAKIHITETGKVIIRPDRQCVIRERSRLKAMKEKVDSGEMEFIEVYNQFKSWKGYLEYFNSYKSIKRINELFDELFIKDWRTQQNVKGGKEKNMGTETTTTSNIQLADGTELTCQLNGTEYETDSPVDESIFSEENLAVVIIDGERKTNQVLNSCYAFGSGSRFSIRDMTAEEQLNKQITDTQIGLAEVYEMILS